MRNWTLSFDPNPVAGLVTLAIASGVGGGGDRWLRAGGVDWPRREEEFARSVSCSNHQPGAPGDWGAMTELLVCSTAANKSILVRVRLARSRLHPRRAG